MNTNIIEEPCTNPCSNSHLIFHEEAQNMHWRKDSVFDKSAGKSGFSSVED
jgi:hypothetical protein